MTSQEIAKINKIAELEAYIDELVKAGDGMQRSLNAYLDYTQGLFDYKCYAPEDATSKWQALVKNWKEDGKRTE